MINATYLDLLHRISARGQYSAPREQRTLELIGVTTRVEMSNPIITIPDRRLDYQFMAAEAHWILSGERKLTPPVRKNLSKYSDDGKTMRGAYGPPFLQQVEYVVGALNQDLHTRQAVMTLWERSPRASRDIPCTVSLQWLIRGGILHCCVNMRSSDAWLGFPYDIFTFSMMTLYVKKFLTSTLSLGTLHLFVGSQHLYARNMEEAADLRGVGENLYIDTHGIISPDVLSERLGDIAYAPECDYLALIKEKLCH